MLSGADLRELKEQISFLSGPTDPVTVGEFLSLRRDVMFLELDTAIRHCMINTFLSTGNITAMKVIIYPYNIICNTHSVKTYSILILKENNSNVSKGDYPN